MSKIDYDYVIVGAGCSGLSFAVKLLRAGLLQDKTCLLVDSRLNYVNDKSWCGWNVETTGFEDCVSKTWANWQVAFDGKVQKQSSKQHQYQYIAAKSYYDYCLAIFANCENIKLSLGADVTSITAHAITTTNEMIHGGLIIDARNNVNLSDISGTFLLQCFYGWHIKTEKACFDDDTVTLMDFNSNQNEGINFMYVLPLTDNTAIIEPTYFLHHKKIPNQAHFFKLVEDYMQRKYNVSSFQILQTESGVLPMTQHYNKQTTDGLLQIGSAHGLLRPGTGYAFYGIQRHNQAIIDALLNQVALPISAYNKTTLWMDEILLRVCNHAPEYASKIFYQLFERTNGDQIAHFMQDSANYYDYLKVILGVPKKPFIREAAKLLTEKLT